MRSETFLTLDTRRQIKASQRQDPHFSRSASWLMHAAFLYKVSVAARTRGAGAEPGEGDLRLRR
jgi:hypothetical protein